LIVAQVAVSMVLLCTASLLMGTFLKLLTLPSGVEPRQLSVFQVALKGDPYANTQHTTQFVNTVLEDLRRQPGVDSVAAINGLPMDRGLNIGGYPANHRDLSRIVEFRTVTPGYFRAVGIPLLEGRDIEESDRAGTDPVILIGAAAARRYWPSRSPIGESFRVGGANLRIIGVVADVKNRTLLDTGDVVLYAPMVQQSDKFTGMINNWYPTTFAIRVAADVDLAAAARRAVDRADPQIPIARFSTMQAVIDSTIREPRFLSMLASGFSVFALALTAIGLFGLLSYQVAQRTREIGTRMALGADRMSVLRMFLGRGLLLASAGVVLGLAAVRLVNPAVQHLLADTGIDASQGARSVIMNTTLAAIIAAVAMLISAIAASWLPARRAASVEPMQALRTE
jgi:predicted permease